MHKHSPRNTGGFVKAPQHSYRRMKTMCEMLGLPDCGDIRQKERTLRLSQGKSENREIRASVRNEECMLVKMTRNGRLLFGVCGSCRIAANLRSLGFDGGAGYFQATAQKNTRGLVRRRARLEVRSPPRAPQFEYGGYDGHFMCILDSSSPRHGDSLHQRIKQR